MSVEVKQEDREHALALRTAIEGARSGGEQALYRSGAYDHTHEVQAFAAHRRQAEEAMRERALAACRAEALVQPTTTEWADGYSEAIEDIEAAIRSIDTRGE